MAAGRIARSARARRTLCGRPIVSVLDVPDVPGADPQRLAILVLELTELITGAAESHGNLGSGHLQHDVVPYLARRSEDHCARHRTTVPSARSSLCAHRLRSVSPAWSDPLLPRWSTGPSS